jgi:hypothetical protein
MCDKTRVISLIVALSVVLCLITCSRKEGFATRQDKAQAIHSWFTNTPVHTYTSYKRAMGGASNIVEYEDVLNLFHNNRDFTTPSGVTPAADRFTVAAVKHSISR